MTNARSALAPCPRSGGLFLIGARQAKRRHVGKRLKIASWNINSVRARTALVERLIAEQQPDILCLQETKVLDSIFPADLFDRHGYVHRQLNGQRMHHGVAILSRVPLRGSGQARLAGQWRGAARRRAARMRDPARERLCARPAATSPDRTRQPEVRPEARLHRADDALVRRAERADDHRRRLQRRAARMRRLEPQGAAQRRQPHAGRGRRADPAAAGARLDRHRPQVRPGARALLHLVELSLARLDQERPRPPARPYVGVARACRRISWRIECSSRAATGSGRPTMCR